ncbi:hypothetical protein RJ639_023844 [Escallonia herrerae]|uniref:Pectinesterase n=1 Tax=Escallonia herrerae TaxID=1293975 RepID=A0AA89AF63_9ASTE|nr:hypothetical protein RJ639_023844 [Escallonia herrerae]
MTYIAIEAVILTIILFIPVVVSDDNAQIPPQTSHVDNWFRTKIKAYTARKRNLDPALAVAEAGTKVIKVRADGTGDFKTVTDAINSISNGNKNRVIVSIGGGNYTEKIRIVQNKPFVTFYGAPNDMPTLVYAGTAVQYGTVDSATLIVESDYFSAVNVIIAVRNPKIFFVLNSAPRPDGRKQGAQAVALRVAGDKAAFYNCKLIGFQDTVCDDKGRHFYKDCYIEGTVDFIFGNAKSLFVNVETHVIPGDGMSMITAQARESGSFDSGFSFVHCNVTGTGGNAYLGRAWKPFAKVVYAYTAMSDVVKPEGWSDNFHPDDDKTVFYGEYDCSGPGSDLSHRVGFAKKLGDADVKPFLSLSFVEGSKWLLPPASL